MPKTDSAFGIAGYAPVADRIALFYSRFPAGRIVTDLVLHSDTQVIFKAMVYRSLEEPHPAATGWAAERIGDGAINTVACVENTETSAVGRALANLGLTASRHRPSLDEIENSAHSRLGDTLSRVPAHVDVPPTVVPGARGRPASTPERVPRADRRPAPIRVLREPSVPPFDPQLQRLADRVTDLFGLIEEAERAGLAPEAARKLRSRLHERSVAPSIVAQAERTLRKWLAERTAVVLGEAAPSIPAIEPAGGDPARASVTA